MLLLIVLPSEETVGHWDSGKKRREEKRREEKAKE
jgi:hypothetical protein